MRLSKAAGLVALMEVATSLPLANFTGSRPSHIDSGLLPHGPFDLTSTDLFSAEMRDFITIIGLLPDFNAVDIDVDLDNEADLNSLERRGEKPPRTRKVAEQMKSLPECFQTCFRSENGKVGVDIDAWDLNEFCYGSNWPRTQWWLLNNVVPCAKWQCRNHMGEIKGAGKRWKLETCP